MSGNYPIIIVGNGLAGKLIALALQKISIEPLLISSNAEVQNDSRTTAISRKSLEIIENFISPLIAEQIKNASGRIEQIAIFDSAVRSISKSESYLNFLGTNSPMGYVIQNQVLAEILQSRAIVEQVHTIDKGDLGKGSLACVNNYKAELVLLASGARSSLLDQLDLTFCHYNYNQIATIFNIEIAGNHNNIAVERFLPNGPLALLPLAATNQYSIVLTSKTKPDNVLEYLIAHSGDYAPSPRIISAVESYPLKLQFAHKVRDERILLFGDAAHAIHPIAGQGFNLTITDLAQLIPVLKYALLTGEDMARCLLQYRSNHLTMIAATHGLNLCFANKNICFSFFRKLTTEVVGTSPAIKAMAIKLAGG